VAVSCQAYGENDDRAHLSYRMVHSELKQVEFKNLEVKRKFYYLVQGAYNVLKNKDNQLDIIRVHASN